MEKVTALLVAEQKKAVNNMLGEPFEIKFEPRRPSP
jgi:hypothetical protein